MSSLLTVRITGLSELQAKLESLPKQVARNILRKTLKDVGGQLRQDMADLAPKRSGLMAENFDVRVRIRGDELAATAFVGPKSGVYYPGVGDKRRGTATGKFAKKGGVIPTLSVARFQEFGTKGKHPIPANDFMVRAFNEWKDWGVQQIINNLRDAIEEASR